MINPKKNLRTFNKIEKVHLNYALSKCDLLYLSTFPSKVWKYGQSLNKIIDYMLSSRPILASYTGYLSMINESECGKIVPSGDLTSLRKEIIRFSKMSSIELDKMGRNGKDWILANQDYKTLANKYYSFIKSI